MQIQTKREGEAAVAAVSGKLDMVTAAEFQKALGEVIASGAKRVVLDLGELSYVSSAGIGAVMTLARELRTRGGELRLSNLRDNVAKIFDVCGIAKVVPVHGSVAEALAAGA
jgi:anti-anti-sigma factor